MPQRTQSCPSPKAPVSPNAQTTSTNPVSPLQDSTFRTMSPQRRANTCPAECPKRPQNKGQSAQDHQDAPYTSTPQALGTELPDFVLFGAIPGASEWQISQNADGNTVYSTVGVENSVTVEILPTDW
ncbi:hypothetical protein M407DRAFT_190974 [Tulasnella calospora MUT 4182]|uniref:Uncharacterized protein n=1 Tax=Tulasnella calospora MUT 4182 TaxID=1051891 RepID=A0A0C3PP77_9AGAM|nr:hypothetical protein M407DRAFT_190974 [Tulasnella calospora MUT 4182]